MLAGVLAAASTHWIGRVVGPPLQCPKTVEPSRELVEQYLERYIDSLTQLYNDNRHKYNVIKKPELEVI